MSWYLHGLDIYLFIYLFIFIHLGIDKIHLFKCNEIEEVLSALLYQQYGFNVSGMKKKNCRMDYLFIHFIG